MYPDSDQTAAPTPSSRFKHKLAAAALGGVALLGVGATIGPVVASAQDTPAAHRDSTGPRTHAHPVRAVLEALVADGTLTQDQADSVIARLDAGRPEGAPTYGSKDRSKDGPGRGDHMHGAEHGQKHKPGHLDAAASAIGISTGELRIELRSGKSLAAVAEAHGVSPDALVDALVEAARSEITDMVQRTPGQHDAPDAGKGSAPRDGE